MIKTKSNCELKNVEYELKMQLNYDPDCKVIAIIPSSFRLHQSTINGRLETTHVTIIWDSK